MTEASKSTANAAAYVIAHLSLESILERFPTGSNRKGIPDSGAFLIQHAGWSKEASMDGSTFVDGPAAADGRCG